MKNYDILTADLLKEVGKIIKENKSIKKNNLIEYNEYESYDEDGGLLDGFEDPDAAVDFEEVDVPEVDGPEVDVPEVDVPEVDVPEVDGPEVMAEIDGLDTEEQVEYLLNNGYDEESIIALLAPNESVQESTEEIEESTEEIEESTEEIEESTEEIEESTEEIEESTEEIEEEMADLIDPIYREAVNYFISAGLKKKTIESVTPGTLMSMYQIETSK